MTAWTLAIECRIQNTQRKIIVTEERWMIERRKDRVHGVCREGGDGERTGMGAWGMDGWVHGETDQ